MKNQGRGTTRSSNSSQTNSTQQNSSERNSSQQSQNDMRGSDRGMNQNMNEGFDSHESMQDSSGAHIPSALAQALPRESRENIERVLGRSREFIHDTRVYVRENPREATGLFIFAGMFIWALFGTKPGRRVVEMGSSYATPLLSQWINSNLNFSPGNFNRGSMH